MKRRRIFLAIFAIAVFTITLLCRLWPRTIPEEKCSEVYRKYADVEGISAAFIKNKHVDDSIKVDVTVIMATDSIGWDRLKSDFKIPDIPEQAQKMLQAGGDMIWTRYGCAEDPSKSAESTVEKRVVVTMSPKMRSVCVFHAKDEKQATAIFIHNLRYNINQCKTNNTKK